MSSTPTKLDRVPLLGTLLRLANQAIQERLLVWLEQAGHEAIQPTHLAVTQALWDAPEGLRLTALARAGRITKQSMSALVEHLEKTGYVARVPDPDDARAVRVRLTERGRSFGRAIRDFVRGVEADWSERIGARHVEGLRMALELLRRSLFAVDRAAGRRGDEDIYPSPVPIRPSRLPTRRPSVTKITRKPITKINRGPLLGALLRLAFQAMQERVLVWLEEAGHEAIQLAHLAVIQPLWFAPEGLRLTALARAGRITKQSMSALVEHLEKTGYVARVPDPDDARAVRVRLTERGRSFTRALRDVARSVEADWSERIGACHVEELRMALELLRRSLFAADRAADRRDNEGIYPSPVPIRPSRLPTRRPSATSQRTLGAPGGRSGLPGGAGRGVKGRTGREEAPDTHGATHPERQRNKPDTGGPDSAPVEQVGRRRPGR